MSFPESIEVWASGTFWTAFLLSWASKADHIMSGPSQIRDRIAPPWTTGGSMYVLSRSVRSKVYQSTWAGVNAGLFARPWTDRERRWSVLQRFQNLGGMPGGFDFAVDLLDFAVGADDEGAALDAHE